MKNNFLLRTIYCSELRTLRWQELVIVIVQGSNPEVAKHDQINILTRQCPGAELTWVGFGSGIVKGHL